MADNFFELLCGPQQSFLVTILGIIRCKVLFEAMKGPVHTDLKRGARGVKRCIQLVSKVIT